VERLDRAARDVRAIAAGPRAWVRATDCHRVELAGNQVPRGFRCDALDKKNS
jgi:hypothetical protein